MHLRLRDVTHIQLHLQSLRCEQPHQSIFSWLKHDRNSAQLLSPMILHIISARKCEVRSPVKEAQFPRPKAQALNHCIAEMLPFFLISACSCGKTSSGSKPSISATRPAVLGSILPYVMKIACTYARPSDPTGHGFS